MQNDSQTISEKAKLMPKRSKKEAYDDVGSIAGRRFVPEKY
jgi:hypothetical protein